VKQAFSWRNAAYGLAFLGGGFVIIRLGSLGEYGRVLLDNALLLLPATALICLAILMWGLGWALILTALDSSTGTRDCLRVFLLSWLGRYVPGTLPYHASRVLAAEALGTKSSKVATSIAYETVLLLGSGALVGSFFVVVGLGAKTSSYVFLIALAPLLTLPFILQPKILVPVANRLLCLARREPLGTDALLSGPQTVGIFLWYGLGNIINGSSFALVLLALDGGLVSPAIAIGAYSIAGIVGTAAIFVPSGIGVREGVIVALMSSVMEPEQALLAAGVARAVSIVADIVPVALMVGFGVTSRALIHLRRPARRPAEIRQQRG
jgi:uncharacterized membrane protein YbhN (UPF0104 family)